MIRSRRQNFASLPLALSSASENTHWNLSATMLSCPWSIWDSFRGIQSHTHNWSFGWITIKIHNTIKHLKVPTYDPDLISGSCSHSKVFLSVVFIKKSSPHLSGHRGNTLCVGFLLSQSHEVAFYAI